MFLNWASAINSNLSLFQELPSSLRLFPFPCVWGGGGGGMASTLCHITYVVAFLCIDRQADRQTDGMTLIL